MSAAADDEEEEVSAEEDELECEQLESEIDEDFRGTPEERDNVDKEVEENFELSSTSSGLEPDLKFKDPKKSAKKPLKVLPTDGDVDPTTEASLPLSKKKPTTPKPKPDKTPKDIDEESGDEIEEEPELVSTPGELEPDLKFKDPKKSAKKPLKVLPTDGDVDLTTEASLPLSKKKPITPKQKPDKTPKDIDEESGDEIEEEPELVSTPGELEPDLKFKDSKKSAKKPLKVLPTDGDVDPTTEASLPLSKKKPTTPKSKPDKPPKDIDEESGDEIEEEPELVSTPGELEPNLKFKDPKKSAKKPLKVRPADGVVDPTTQASLPPSKKKPTTPKSKPDKTPRDIDEEFGDEIEEEPELVSTPGKLEPDLKFKDPKKSAKKPLKVRPTDDDVDPTTEASLPLFKKKPTTSKSKQDKAPKDIDEEPGDEIEEEPVLVSTPGELEPNLKFKDPKKSAMKPLKVRPADGDVDPTTQASLPLSKKKPRTPKSKPDKTPKDIDEESGDEIEEEPELVSTPGKLEPDLKFKDPKKSAMKPLKVRPADGDVDPTTQASLPLSKKKPTTPKSKPDKAPKDIDEESGDEIEEEPELVSTPGELEPDLKFKDPKKSAKKPLKVRPADGDIDPTTEASLPLSKKKPTAPKAEPSGMSKKPPPLMSVDGDVNPVTDVTLPLAGCKPEDNEELSDDPEDGRIKLKSESDPGALSDEENNPPRKPKRKVSFGRKKSSKPKWIPPARTPPEPYEFPPEEKSLCERLKMDNISPAKRYAKKPKELDVSIPFFIPWENLPALQTQEGMGAFGHQRNPVTRVDLGAKDLTQGPLHTETVIPLISQAKGASKSGMLPFGAYRRNKSEVIDNHGFDDTKLHLSASVIPRLMLGLTSSQSGEAAFGTLRNQTTTVKYAKYMSSSCDQQSHGFISRQFAPTSLELAGTCIMDRRRDIVPNIHGYGDLIPAFDRASETVVPRLFGTQDINTRSGSSFGAFRPIVSKSEGGYKMTYDEELLCKLVIPYQTSPSNT